MPAAPKLVIAWPPINVFACLEVPQTTEPISSDAIDMKKDPSCWEYTDNLTLWEKTAG